MVRSPLGEQASAASPNPDIIRRDPMAELFGPGSTVKFIGEPEDEMPDAVRSVIEEFNLSKTSFQCVLKELPEGTTFNADQSSAQNTVYIKGWSKSIPSTEYIAKNYGPGSYILQFTWRTKSDDTDGVSKAMHHEIPIEISHKALDEFKKHRLQKKIADASAQGTQIHDALVEKKIEGEMVKALSIGERQPDVNPAQAAKEYITQTLETVKMMGLPIGYQPPPASRIEWDKLLPAVIAGVTAFMQMQQQSALAQNDKFEKMLMLMMTQSQNSNAQLLDLMKVQAGTGSGANQFKEFKDMILGAMDIKEMMSGGPKETLADKIFRVVEGLAPQILMVAAQAQAAKANGGGRVSPVVGMAKGYIDTNPDFVALRGNPEEMHAFIAKMDEFYGWKQTDMVLGVAGWERPLECPRDPAKEKPADERENANEEIVSE